MKPKYHINKVNHRVRSEQHGLTGEIIIRSVWGEQLEALYNLQSFGSASAQSACFGEHQGKTNKDSLSLGGVGRGGRKTLRPLCLEPDFAPRFWS